MSRLLQYGMNNICNSAVAYECPGLLVHDAVVDGMDNVFVL